MIKCKRQLDAIAKIQKIIENVFLKVQFLHRMTSHQIVAWTNTIFSDGPGMQQRCAKMLHLLSWYVESPIFNTTYRFRKHPVMI